MPKRQDFVDYFGFDGDYCCVYQLWGDPTTPTEPGLLALTALRSSHCNGYCWRCRLRTVWQALRGGPVSGDMEFLKKADVETLVGRLRAAAARVWPDA